MTGAVMATKLYVPRLRPGSVARPRLRERLRRAAGSRLTLVSAPAGFGKTTLLAEWLHETAEHETAEHETAGQARTIAWLSLDPSDSDPRSFWTGVVAALQSVVPGLGAAALQLIEASPSPAPLPTERVLTTLVNELAAAPDDVWLVLDDYHLADSHDLGEGMTVLLDHLPPQVHVVLGTRADPDLPLSRWRGRGELTEVRAGDLRFTNDEVAAYLGEVAGLTLAPQQVSALGARTEGWIAALQLAALSLQGREDVAGFVATFAGDDRYIVDYLVDEVLRHQDGPVREFLQQTAVLDRFTGPLCDAVTGRGDSTDEGRRTEGSSTDLLVTLERANLFVVPLDDRRQWYRYHHLFADVLRARLLAEQPDLVAVLHLRASRWFEQHDLPDEAVAHALAGHDVDRAVHLMELAVPAIRRDRREATLLGWLKVLPDAAVRRSPVLSVFFGYLLMVAGDLDGVEGRLDDAERALAMTTGRAEPDDPSERTLPATIAIFRASIAQARGDVAGTTRNAERALALAGPTDHLERGGAAGFLGLAAWARGEVTGALQTFALAVASLHAAGNVVDALNSTVVLADMWLAAGRPATARRLCEQALQRAEEQGDLLASAAADLHVGISEIDCEMGDLESAARHLDQATALGGRASRTESRYRWFVAKARLVDAEGDPQQAVTLLDEAERLYRPGFFPDVRPIAAMRARIWIAQGDLSSAAEWARQREVSLTDDAGYLGEYDQLTLVRLLLAQYRARPVPGALDPVVALLIRLDGAAAGSGRDGSLAEIRMLHALTLAAQSSEQLSEQSSVGLSLAESGADSLSERELQVLRLLDSELTGPQIARELFVSHNTLRTHTKHIFTKLDVTSRRAAVRRGRERGLL
jgi:LuxR family transcriptional regulator, maltose regulon positive regulatory protein